MKWGQGVESKNPRILNLLERIQELERKVTELCKVSNISPPARKESALAEPTSGEQASKR